MERWEQRSPYCQPGHCRGAGNQRQSRPKHQGDTPADYEGINGTTPWRSARAYTDPGRRLRTEKAAGMLPNGPSKKHETSYGATS